MPEQQQLITLVQEMILKVDVIDDQQREILMALKGNPTVSTDKGLVGQMSRIDAKVDAGLSEHNDRITALEKTKDKWWNWGIAAAFVIGVLWGILKVVFPSLHK